MDKKPVVNWQSPELVPQVKVGESETFWIAVQRHGNGASPIYVFDAQYINMPLNYAPDDIHKEDPVGEYCEDSCGYPVDTVGWHSTLNHPEYSSYYEPISFDENNVLMGWAKYQKPEFNQ